MPIPGSGSLNMSQINAEFGRGLNLNSYRGTGRFDVNDNYGYFGSGAIYMSEFYNSSVQRKNLTALDYVNSTNSTTNAIVIPGNAAQYDLCIWMASAKHADTAVPPDYIPSGFNRYYTHGGTSSGNGTRQSYGFKILNAGDAGTTVYGLSSTEGQLNGLVVLRPNKVPLVGIAAFHNQTSGTGSANPDMQYIPQPPDDPAILMGICSVRLSTPTVTGSLATTGSALWITNRSSAYWQVQNGYRSSRSYDVNDPGSNQNHLTTSGLYVW